MSNAEADCKRCGGKSFTALVPGHTVFIRGTAAALRALKSRAG